MCHNLELHYRLRMGSEFLWAIFVIMVFAGPGQRLVHSEDRFDTVQAAVFSRRAYPNPGTIPVLNRKMFRATRVQVGEHPYVASIRRLHAHYLTGAILSAHAVVTVAHPIHDVPVTDLGVVTGQTYCDRGAAYMSVLVVLVHNAFNPFTLESDIALLRIYETIFPKSTQKPIPLFAGFHLRKRPKLRITQDNAFVTGWGRCDWNGNELCLPRSSKYYPDEKQDPILRTISFNHSRLAKSEYCVAYESVASYHAGSTLCVGEAREMEPLAPCLAVPGAPLVVEGRLVGLLSWGFGCGYMNDLPLVYTDLRAFDGWVVSHLNKMEELDPNDVSELYIAATAYSMEEWVAQTTGRRPADVSPRDPQLRAANIDYQLIKWTGVTTDFRDYAYGGKLRSQKEELYQTLRADSEYQRQLKRISENILSNMKSPKPFLSHHHFLVNSSIDDISK